MAANRTATILFAGGGGVEAGLTAAGIDCTQRVEFDADICAVNEANFGPGIICAPVQLVDLSCLSPTDYLWASPPCQGASVARSKRLEAREDDGAGIHILDYVRALKPRAVCLENVPPYQSRPVFHAIVQGLVRAGYRVDWRIVNCADFGVPQTRKRLILRAVREGETLLPLTPTHTKVPQPAGMFGPALLPWNGWYGAIEDILDTLPESEFAPWQLLRLKNAPFADFLHMTGNTQKANPSGTGILPCSRPANTVCTNSGRGAKAFLIDSQNKGSIERERSVTARRGDRPSFTVSASAHKGMPKAVLTDSCVNTAEGRDATCRTSHEPSFTIKATAMHRPITTPKAWLDAGRVVTMTPRALARFQGFPDTFVLPAGRTLASKVIGNVVPPPLAWAVAKTILGGIQ